MMTQKDLIARLSERLEWTETNVTKILEALIDTVIEELKAGNRLDIDDFGLFQTKKYSEYIFVDSDTNERYLMPPSLEIIFETYYHNTDIFYFIPDETLEKDINSSFSLFEPTLINEGVELTGISEVFSNQPKDKEDIQIQPSISYETKRPKSRKSHLFIPLVSGIAIAIVIRMLLKKDR